jgi:hypothetical protein
MRYIVGVIVLLVAVCAVGVFLVEEGFDNVNGKTAADYYNSVSGQFRSPDSVSSESDISGSDISGTPNKVIMNPSSYSESLLLYSKNAKVYPDGSSSNRSSPGSSNQTGADKSPSLTQGQSYGDVNPVTNDDGRYASPSDLMPGDNSYAPEDDEGNIAVRVGNQRKPNTCPDMSQYIRKDAIPCWGCKL